MACRWQAVIEASDCLIYWRTYASFGHELKHYCDSICRAINQHMNIVEIITKASPNKILSKTSFTKDTCVSKGPFTIMD